MFLWVRFKAHGVQLEIMWTAGRVPSAGRLLRAPDVCGAGVDVDISLASQAGEPSGFWQQYAPSNDS